MAGSSKNAQPIRVVLVTSAATKDELAGCGDFTGHLAASPLVAVIVRLGESRPFDAGRVAQNMMIAAHAGGVASCPSVSSTMPAHAGSSACPVTPSWRWRSRSATRSPAPLLVGAIGASTLRSSSGVTAGRAREGCDAAGV